MSETIDSPASPFDGVKMRRTRGMVILSLAPGASCGTYAHITEALGKNGLTAIPDTAPDGACLLRISGYKSPDDVIQVLNRQGINPQDITDPSIDKKLKTLDRLKNRSLSVSGITYLLGDASLFISGLLAKAPKEALAGLAYAGGGLVSAIFGNPSEARQIRNIGVRLGDFLAYQGADIPRESTLGDVMSQRRGGLAEKVENFLYRHPSEVHNLIYAVGGAQLFRSGLQKHTSKIKGGWEDMAAGGLVTSGGLVGGLVPEKQGKDNHSSGILHWIQEKPLRLAGYLYTLNNVFLFKSAWEEYKAAPKQKSYIFKFATAGLFLVANAFMSMTSRSHHTQDARAEDQRHIVEGMAAQVIAAQPESIQGALTRQVAGFLAVQPETRQDKTMIEESLTRKIAALSTNPWQPTSSITSLAPEMQSQMQQARPQRAWTDRTDPIAPEQTQASLGM